MSRIATFIIEEYSIFVTYNVKGDSIMTESINIRNCSNSIFFSEISHDMFCDKKLPTHGLMMIYSGKLIIETKAEQIEAHAGDCIFWHRNCLAGMKKMSDGDTPFRSIAILLDNKILRNYFSENLAGKRLPMNLHSIYSPGFRLPHNIKIDSLFMSLKPYADQVVNPDENIIRLKQEEAINCLLELDARMYPTLFDFYESWKIDLLEFMERHFMEDLTMKEFASYTGRSLATFKRDFAKVSNLSPKKWIFEQRLELSHRLLRDTKVKPSTVYYEVGFKNRTHFSGLFKQRYGITPAAYQEKMNK